MKEKALRDTQIRSMHEMGEMKRLTSQIQEVQDKRNRLSDSEEFQEVESNNSGKISHVPCPSPCSMLSCDNRLPLDTWNLSGSQENVFGNPRSVFESSQTPCQGSLSLHSTTPSATGAIPVHVRTGTPVARGEERIGSTIRMPTFAGRPSTMNLFFASGFATEFYGWTAKTADIGTSI